MAQRRVEQDDNVTIIHTKIPEERYTAGTHRDPPQEYVRVRLSDQARQFLRRQGYSEKFITGLHMMLQESTNLIHNTIIRSGQPGPNSDFSRPDPPRRMQMPPDLQHSWMRLGEGRNALMMPDIGPYFPNVTYYPETHRAFASAEGQRFMSRYYTTGWLRQDAQSGEWTISPPVPLAQITPRRTQ